VAEQARLGLRRGTAGESADGGAGARAGRGLTVDEAVLGAVGAADRADRLVRPHQEAGIRS